MTHRIAILCCSLLSGLASVAHGQSEPPGRVLPLPPIAPIPTPAPPDLPTAPPPRPNLSTSFQLPKDGRSPFEAPGPVIPDRPPELPRPTDTDLPVGGRVTLPSSSQQVIRFGPRYGVLNTAKSEPMPNDDDPTKQETQRITYQGGLVIHVEYLTAGSSTVRRVELAADNVVMWVKGVKADFGLNDTLKVDRPEEPKAEVKPEVMEEKKRIKVQMYLAGNVVIRTRSDDGPPGTGEQVFRAREIFYDVDDSRAIAVDADLETTLAQGLDSVHLRAREIHQLGKHELHAFDAVTFSSKRPADPTLTFEGRRAVLTEQVTERRNIFGRVFRDARTGRPDISTERRLVSEENTVRILGFPVYRSRQATFDLDDPFGPLALITVRSDRVNGPVQVYSTFDAYDLLGVRAPQGNRWLLYADYLSLRGPGVGTDFTYRDSFGPAYKNVGAFTAYGLYDNAKEDILGGFRGLEPEKPYWRGKLQWTHNQDLYEEGTAFTRLQAQFAYQTDKNFNEQFYKIRYDQDPNPETFLYLYGGSGNFAWSGLGEVNVNRPWVTETQWLPRLDAALIGQSFFDTVVSTTRVNGGYALLRPASQSAQPTQPGEQRDIDTVRGDVYQRLSVPFDLGPVRLEPYGIGSVTGYSANATTNDGVGRVYGGGGFKASIPFSRLYPEVASDLLNLRGLNHKVELRTNYFVASSSTSHTELPYLDRLNDEATDYSYRGWRRFGGLAPAPGDSSILFGQTAAGQALTTSPAFDPQQLANRRLLQSRAEVLDDMHAVQAGVYQRWQTKRGPSGGDHTVDVMALDLTATYFPNRGRDNYGESFGLLEYNWVWNVGDRTAFTSSGWYDPFDQGTKYLNLGVYYNRPDGSNFYLGYRHTDPISSRVLVAVLGYQFSKKYSVSLTNVFDLSNNFSQGTTVAFNRTGTDMTMSLGVSYNSFQNNFGLQFLIVPNASVYNRNGLVGNLTN